MSDLAELDALFDADDGEEFSLGGLSPEIDEQLCPEGLSRYKRFKFCQ